MPAIDLTRYIVASDGPWTDPAQDDNLFGFTVQDTVSPERLLLRWAGDFVALTGPLSIRVTVQAENMTLPLALVGNLAPNAGVLQRGTDAAGVATETLTRPATASLNEAAMRRFGTSQPMSLQASTIYTYTLDIAAGQAWPFSLSEHLESSRLQNARGSRYEQLGNNLGYRVLIEPAFAVRRGVPVGTGADLPCDFAVADQPHGADFFPSSCEPCNGGPVTLPPGCATSLATPAAEGGCVRTHFFDGMFISREDLETEQRYHRLKSKLHNRAAGEGVVWGFGLGQQGTHVCVMPGYGVDCCGNDLVLTTVYEVEVASLLADPALAALPQKGRGGRHVQLLLEYVECPSHPRPVHGDVCAPDANRCEMSRIRESVRLRLVPPRDPLACVESLPLAQFLAEVKELRRRYPMAQQPEVPGAGRAPFQLRFTAPNLAQPLLVRPSADLDRAALDPLRGQAAPITVELVPDALWTLAAGAVTAQVSARGTPVPGGAAPESVSLGAGDDGTVVFQAVAAARVDTFTYELKGWQALALFASQDDLAPSGDLQLTMRLGDNQVREIELRQSVVTARALDLAEAPCEGTSCQPRRRGDPANDCRDTGRTAATGFEAAFNRLLDTAAEEPASVLPWLHADPARPKSAGDPKALLLAALGAWLAQAMVRERAGAAGEVGGARRELAQGIYRLAWVLLFGISKRADPTELGGTLKRLLEAWCDALLWKGPRCCGEPHGVVIGCALLEGGTLRHLDPFGGRRHVVHYPLLAHWGAQFGLAPLDITASGFFSKLCCLGSLPAPAGRPREEFTAVLAPVGGGYLAMGEPQDIAAKLDGAVRGATIASRRAVGTPEMIAAAVALVGTKATKKQVRFDALTLADGVADQTVVLFVPV